MSHNAHSSTSDKTWLAARHSPGLNNCIDPVQAGWRMQDALKKSTRLLCHRLFNRRVVNAGQQSRLFSLLAFDPSCKIAARARARTLSGVLLPPVTGGFAHRTPLIPSLGRSFNPTTIPRAAKRPPLRQPHYPPQPGLR